MAAKVFESLGKLGLGLAVAGGVVNSALYNGEWEKPSASSSLCIFFFIIIFVCILAVLCFYCSWNRGRTDTKPCRAALYLVCCTSKRVCGALSLGNCRVVAALVGRLGDGESWLRPLLASLPQMI